MFSGLSQITEPCSVTVFDEFNFNRLESSSPNKLAVPHASLVGKGLTLERSISSSAIHLFEFDMQFDSNVTCTVKTTVWTNISQHMIALQPSASSIPPPTMAFSHSDPTRHPACSMGGLMEGRPSSSDRKLPDGEFQQEAKKPPNCRTVMAAGLSLRSPLR